MRGGTVLQGELSLPWVQALPSPQKKKTGLSPRGQATGARNLINIKDQIQGYPTRI